MKQIALLVLIISITTLSFGQRKIKKLEVNEIGYSSKVSMTPIIDEIEHNGLKIKIEPISIDKLNSQFLKESSISGKFEYTYYDNSRKSYFLKKRKKRWEKSDYEFLNEGVIWLLDNEIIDQYEHDDLIKQITYYFDEKTAQKTYSIDRIISSNPYYIQDKYLSVFKIEISNPTQSDITLNEAITIQNGNLIYNPLSVEFITTELRKSNLLNVNKMFTLERHNLKESIIIPPNTSFEKLFAVLPIEYSDKYLEISLSGTNTKFKWEINKDEVIINEQYSFLEFNIDWEYSGIKADYAKNFNLFRCKHSAIFLSTDELFIGDESLNEEFEIFTLSLHGIHLYYGRSPDLKGQDFINDKNKRKTITLKTVKISDLKKKVKQ